MEHKTKLKATRRSGGTSSKTVEEAPRCLTWHRLSLFLANSYTFDVAWQHCFQQTIGYWDQKYV